MDLGLTIYTREVAGADELSALVRAFRGLDVEPGYRGSLVVVHNERRRPWQRAQRRESFQIYGPNRVELEDVPEEVLACVPDPRYHWIVGVEGPDTVVPHAMKFAFLLIQALDGVIFDSQTGDVWSPSGSRTVVRPEGEQRIDEVQLDWYCLHENLTASPASLYVDTATRHLPEALPRRFGEREPYQGKLDDVGPDGFGQAWVETESLLFFAGSAPVIGGHLHAGPSATTRHKFWRLSLRVHAAPLSDPVWRDALRPVFTTLADSLPAFLATAQVTRGHLWNGRSSGIDARTEEAPTPVRGGCYLGLPPIPMWWTWLGAPFGQYAGLLPQERTTPTATGLLFENSDVPLPRDELDPLSTWLPNDVFASLAPNPNGYLGVPLTPATVIPSELRQN
ncbi:MAG: hypothetical protein FWD11_08955 [Micrococcales bacterium]|nr:hypothetical protein [Micrococcales bacterium]